MLSPAYEESDYYAVFFQDPAAIAWKAAGQSDRRNIRPEREETCLRNRPKLKDFATF